MVLFERCLYPGLVPPSQSPSYVTKVVYRQISFIFLLLFSILTLGNKKNHRRVPFEKCFTHHLPITLLGFHRLSFYFFILLSSFFTILTWEQESCHEVQCGKCLTSKSSQVTSPCYATRTVLLLFKGMEVGVQYLTG